MDYLHSLHYLRLVPHLWWRCWWCFVIHAARCMMHDDDLAVADDGWWWMVIVDGDDGGWWLDVDGWWLLLGVRRWGWWLGLRCWGRRRRLRRRWMIMLLMLMMMLDGWMLAGWLACLLYWLRRLLRFALIDWIRFAFIEFHMIWLAEMGWFLIGLVWVGLGVLGFDECG